LHSSPYLKPFKYTKYTPTDTRKKSKEQLRADEAVWAENRSKAEEIFEECSVLIAKLKEKEHKEVLVSSTESPTIGDISETINEATDRRKSSREKQTFKV